VHGPLCIPEGLAALREGLAGAEASRVVIAPARIGSTTTSSRRPRSVWTWSAGPTSGSWWLEQAPRRRADPAPGRDTSAWGSSGSSWSRKPERQNGRIDTSLLVVGAGISGLTAALEAANPGHDVHLVERQAELGGWTAKFAKLFSHPAPYRELEPVRIAELIDAVVAHPRITVYTGAEITAVAGEPGGLMVTLEQGGKRTDFRPAQW